MRILADSSVWIAFFRGLAGADTLDRLIEEDLVVVNDLILAEILPPLKVQRRNTLVELLLEIERFPLDIDWEAIVQMQVMCLRRGINKVGISDLIIAQHAMQHGLEIFTLDKHFRLMSDHMPLAIFSSK